eukprot:TRINITY_DN8663_c0_g1_i3.p1 TRINITY_DN8663_c0_g1~~TRINITY_DN8663_c0_g1_i3.p1  ORF type:complete len:209 (+),score=45.94 TRINITY_DN8663_c0_g1_i3:118-744(+)
MIRRPPRSTLSSSSAASDVYKRQYQRRVRGVRNAMEQLAISTKEPRGESVELNGTIPSGWKPHKWYEEMYVPSDSVGRPPNDGKLQYKACAMVFATVEDAIADYKLRLPCEGGFVEVLDEGSLDQGGMFVAVRVCYPEGSSSLNHPVWSAMSYLQKPGMSFVITTEATADPTKMKRETFDMLVRCVQSTDCEPPAPSEFSDLDFTFTD